MLEVLETERLLRLTSSGRLAPWLGPALRGLIARQFKRAVCRYLPEEQETIRRYCKGCPHQRDCPYGQTVESDPPAGVAMVSGQDDGVRPLVIAPEFPAPETGRPGTMVRVRVSFAGSAAARHADEFWSAAAVAGRDDRGGLGPDHVTFAVCPPCPPQPPSRWRTVELPTEPDAGAAPVPLLRVVLTSPLFLRQQGQTGRGLVTVPTLADLLRASLRTVGRLCAYYGRAVPDAAFRRLKEAATTVATRSASFRPFRQRKWSNRTHEGGRLSGVIGEATYGPVPAGLVPWLGQGGRLHVGPHRVAGAGGWQVFLLASDNEGSSPTEVS